MLTRRYAARISLSTTRAHTLVLELEPEMSAAPLDEKVCVSGGESTKFLGSCRETMVLITCRPAEGAIEEQSPLRPTPRNAASG